MTQGNAPRCLACDEYHALGTAHGPALGWERCFGGQPVLIGGSVVCKVCGGVVSDAPTHISWHKLGMAL